ncbi:hypothetical protein HYW46_00135 [Candidatus Daviesbacteria bacterium]|nr:hypothetical protein [Candidatus Daviesbacteria bacterium]
MKNKIKIFFAIPCGEFYKIQTEIIRNVCNALDIEPIIIEDDTSTKDLWKKITDAIDEADYFVADIISDSKNITLELGYVIREKKIKYYGIFTPRSIPVPSDLRGFTIQMYSGFKDFQNKLLKWIYDNISESLRTILVPETEYSEHETFQDLDKFIRLWSTSPQGSFRLTDEGLRFTNANFPIMTNYLGILKNYEFEFKAKIIRGAVGWIVKGTKPFDSFIPPFFIMFNINLKNEFSPHIFNINMPLEAEIYHRFSTINVDTKITPEKWFTVITRVEGDIITVIVDGKKVFSENFNKEPYKSYYNFQDKQGDVGFRCHPSEEAVIRYIKLKEI